MKTQTMTVTPQMAAEWLKKNKRNRTISRAKVARFVRDQAAGKWVLTHQPVGIAPSFVVDGQHRLTAVKEGGLPIEMNVTVYDTDEEGEAALMAVDITDKRSPGDMLEIAGVMRKGEGRIGSGVCRTLCQAGMGVITISGTTISEIRATYERNKEHVDWAIRALRTDNGKQRFSIAIRTGFAIAHMLEPIKIEAFADHVREAEAPAGSLAQAWLKAEREDKFAVQPQMAAVYTVLAFLRNVVLDEDAPKQVKRGTATSLAWFRTQIGKKREREQRAIEALQTETVQ